MERKNPQHFFILYLQAIPLIDTVDVDHVPVGTMDSKRYATGIGLGGYTEFGGVSGGMTTEDTHLYTQYQKLHGHGDYVGGGMMTGQSKFLSQRQFGAFDGIALSEDFLRNYYLSVSIHLIKTRIVSTTKSMMILRALLSIFVHNKEEG